MTAVFDANVVVKWFVSDPLNAAALEARATWVSPLAPTFLSVEIANAFRRYVVQSHLDLDLARESLEVVGRMIRLIDHKPFLDEALVVACRHNHAVQDCLYAVMARHHGMPLVTADAILARKLGDADGFDIRLIGSRQETA